MFKWDFADSDTDRELVGVRTGNNRSEYMSVVAVVNALLTGF